MVVNIQKPTRSEASLPWSAPPIAAKRSISSSKIPSLDG
jgi:hypothetical protein